jgi:hypothetical protein
VQLVAISDDGITQLMLPPDHALPRTRFERWLGRRLRYLPAAAGPNGPAQAGLVPERGDALV